MQNQISVVLVALLAVSFVSAIPTYSQLRELYNLNEKIVHDLKEQLELIRYNTRLTLLAKQIEAQSAVQTALGNLVNQFKDGRFENLKNILIERINSIATRLSVATSQSNDNLDEVVEEELNFVGESLENSVSTSEHVNTIINPEGVIRLANLTLISAKEHIKSVLPTRAPTFD